MVHPSLHALACDLTGDDPTPTERSRPTVRQAVARLGPGQVIAARHGAKEVCVAALADGQCVSVPDRCPHDGGLLSDGFVDGNRLVCARHGWEFDLETGDCPVRPGVALEVTPVPASPARRRPQARVQPAGQTEITYTATGPRQPGE